MSIQIIPLIDLLNSIICGLCGYHLYKSWQRDKRQRVLLYFSQGYLALVFSYLFFSLPRIIFPEKSFYLGVGFVIAQSLIYLAVAYFAKVTTFFLRVQWIRYAFLLVIAVSIIAVMVNIIYFNHPIYNKSIGVTDWDIHPAVGIFSIVIIGGVLAPSALFFFRQGIKSHDSIVRLRSVILSIGLLFLIITAYTYYMASTYLIALISDLLSLLSFLIIYLGIIYKRGNSVLKLL